MHSIERYGIVALLFLVVTVVAVLMWDGGKNKKKDGLSGATATAPVAPRERAGAEDRRAARRLALAAEPQPGPLARQPDLGASDPRANPLPPAVDPTTTTGAPLDPGTAEARAPAAAPPTTQTPPEEPARETVVGRATQAPTHAYTVRSGDTLSEIAQRELGSARRWNEIVAANPGLDPTRLRAGKTIRIPGAGSSAPARVNPAPARAATSATEEGRTWKVAKGENLWKIAERALGDGKRWKEIAALNPRANPDRLVLGQVLRLPAAAPVKNAAPKKPTGERSPMVASAAGGSARGGRVR